MITLSPVDCDRRWDELVDRQAGSTIFHTMGWLRPIEQIRGLKLHPMAIQRGDETVGLFPVFVGRRGPIRIASSSFRADAPFLGPLVDHGLLGDTLGAFGRWAKKHRIGHSVLTFPHELPDSLRASGGFRHEGTSTYRVDVSGSERAVFRNCAKRCQETIRRAERRGVEIVEGDPRPHLARHMEMTDGVFARNGHKPIFGLDDLHRIVDGLDRAGRLLAVRACLDGRTIGSCLFAAHADTLYALISAADYDYKRYGAYSAMYWHGMRWANLQGLRWFDFTGGGSGGLCFFKASFGATRVPISRLSRNFSPTAAIARWCFLRGIKALATARRLTTRVARTARATPSAEPDALAAPGALPAAES